MRRTLSSGVVVLVAMCACTKAPVQEPAISVSIEVAAGAKSTCVKLSATGDSAQEVVSAGLVRKARIEAAVFPSEALTGTIKLQARGYFGSNGCAEPLTLNEESSVATETFAQGETRKVTLKLDPPAAAVDADGDGFRSSAAGGPDCDDTAADRRPDALELCSNGRDDDCDRAVDCADTSCASFSCDDNNSCTTSEICQANRTCGGGMNMVCTPPAGTCLIGGTCTAASGGCVFNKRDAGLSCDDLDPCTVTDQCRTDGGCGGAPKSCSVAPTQCHTAAGACVPGDGGCVYPVNVGGSCSDGVACSFADSCLADAGCQGTAYTCNAPPGECFVDAGSCLGDGGCSYPVDPAKLFMACTGGVCRQDGGCAPPAFSFAPSNFDPALILPAEIARDVNLNCAADFDSTAGAGTPFVTWCSTQPTIKVFTQAGGPDVVVLPMYRLTIPDAGSLRVRGDRPVILAVYDSALIGGPILANAQLEVPGAGGSLAGCAGAGDAGTADGGKGGGGGGAGYNTAGGAGGGTNGQTQLAGGPGGSFGTVNLVPLVGGCAGGRGVASTAAAGALGGGGGGGIQLSVSGPLILNGVITTSGGGGRPAPAGAPTNGGGGGGGSGGSILVEAANLLMTNATRLTANGGSGGEGSSGNTIGTSGANGSTTAATVATGGQNNAGNNAGNGGNGGFASTAPTAGQTASNSGGGGGGGTGRIRLATPAGQCTDQGAVVSPPASKVSCP